MSKMLYKIPRQSGRPSVNRNTGLPAYSDTRNSDIPATVTLFGSKKGSPFSENPGYSDILHTVTLFGRPNTVTVSGEACNVCFFKIISCYVLPKVTLTFVTGHIYDAKVRLIA